MANRTAWTSGNGQGLSSWSSRTTAFGTADLTSLADSKAVLSSGTAINNAANLDMYMDISAEITIGSSTPRAGAYIGIWLAMLQQDTSTYGDGNLVAGTAATYIPPWSPLAIIPISNTATTLMAGQATGVVIPPQSFQLICYNFTNITFSATAGNNVVSFKTYNINLNN
jgi:hypothetical protein